MPQHTKDLTIQSSSTERQQAVNACMAQLVGEGMTREQAQQVCRDEANKAMGTKEPLS